VKLGHHHLALFWIPHKKLEDHLAGFWHGTVQIS